MRSTKSREFLLPVLFAFLLTCASAPAQTYTVLHTFQGPDGAGPGAPLILDGAGNIYGTTGGGGDTNCYSTGCGTAFVMNKAGKEVALHIFKGMDGFGPSGGLLRDSKGYLFGVTGSGGNGVNDCAGGCGVAFRFNPRGKEAEYMFQGTPNGEYPRGELVEDASGNFYGTTYLGGDYLSGSVFKIDGTTGKESVLYSFTGVSDGCFPYGLTIDSAGNLYGVAQGGGGSCDSGEGVVFEIDPAGNERTLDGFAGRYGAYPNSVLLFDAQGNLYGVTAQGGNNNGGVVYELSPLQGGVWRETVLYSFCSLPNCTDGEEPIGGLVLDSHGNLFGTTLFGGSSGCNGVGCGVVFELTSSGTESVLYTFTGGSDGAFPHAGLTMDGLGNLYGTTTNGGAPCYNRFTCGVVFKITP